MMQTADIGRLQQMPFLMPNVVLLFVEPYGTRHYG